MANYNHYARVLDGVATRTPLPLDLWVLTPENLFDLDWLASSYNFPLGSQWWPIENQSPPLTIYQSYGDETLTLDVARKVVISTRPVIDWTPEQILAYKASIERHISPLAFFRRFTVAEQLAFEMAKRHDPTANTGDQEAAARLRVMEKELSYAQFIDLNSAVLRAHLQHLEDVGILAAGRIDEIIWADIVPVEFA